MGFHSDNDLLIQKVGLFAGESIKKDHWILPETFENWLKIRKFEGVVSFSLATSTLPVQGQASMQIQPTQTVALMKRL